MTSLVDPVLLERLTHGARACEESEHELSLEAAAHEAKLSDNERSSLLSARTRLRELCEGARSCGIRLLLDAEQTHRQPAIRLLAREMMSEFNRRPQQQQPPQLPTVYDTHQAYLRGTIDRIAVELAHAKANGYTLAVKLVRGAYRSGESLRDASALQPSKAYTDAEYAACAERLLEAATPAAVATPAADAASVHAPPPPHAALLVATHNRESALAIGGALLARGGRPEHCGVDFAQILGMADDLTLSLGLAGFNAHKLVPYGHFEEVLPWLLRRLEENNDALSAAAAERPLLRGELKRRLLTLSSR